MVQNNRFIGNINRIPSGGAVQPKPVIKSGQDRFDEFLTNALKGSQQLKFSKHAEMRLRDRHISLSQSQLEKIDQAVSKAEQKGVRDSLILMDTLAFVVNVRNKTVITAANQEELRDNVFTNIDGAVIV